MTSLTTADAPSRASADRGAPASQLTRTLRYAVSSTTTTLRNGMFVFFTVALPIALFLLFNGLYGSQETRGTTVGAVMMVSMAAYGGLGAAINAGAMIQLERQSGWLRQLMVAGLMPRSFVIGKLVAAMAIVLPALLGVMLAGVLFAGVRITLGEGIGVLAVLWICMIPMVLIGLALGLALRPSAVQAASTIGMMALAILGGLWVPAEMFPDWMQTLAQVTPSYWIGQLGTWVITQGELPVRGLLILGAWTLALALACIVLLRRATATSSRR